MYNVLVYLPKANTLECIYLPIEKRIIVLMYGN